MEPPAPVSQKVANRSRLVVVDSMYHQAPNEQPVVAESRWFRWLSSDEQPYGPRTAKVGSEWSSLDCGWLDEAGMLSLQCREGPDIELGMASADAVTPFAIVRIGESCRFEPYNLSCIKVRSTGEQSKYSITLCPE